MDSNQIMRTAAASNAAAVDTAAGGANLASATAFVPTASGTVGPFFPPRFLGEGDNNLSIVTPGAAAAAGERIHLCGHVYEAGRVPRFNTIVELWQADANGRFAHPLDPQHADADPHFMGWGRTWTDQTGYFEFTTVKPGSYLDPVSRQQRAPHINISFTGSGLMRRLVTTLYFHGEPGNENDPVLAVIADPGLRSRLLLTPLPDQAAAPGVSSFGIDIVLQGESETPFFVD